MSGPAGAAAGVDDVGLGAGGVDVQLLDCGQARAQVLGIFVIFMQPQRPLLQGDSPGGGQYAGLAHAATQHFAQACGPLDEGTRAQQQRAHRCAQAFREADADGIVKPGYLGHIAGGLHCRIEHPGAVQVQAQAALIAEGAGLALVVQ